MRSLREDDPDRETGSIELSDEAWLARFASRIRPKLISKEENDAKGKSESPERPAKKDDSKRHKAAVAGVQKEL